MAHVSRIDLNLFAVFDAIYSEGGVTRAAEKLNLTQPAISHALGRLRDMFGDPLFQRQGQRLVPTTVARNIVEPVRRALRTLEATLHETSHFDPASTIRHFTLGLRDILEATVLPALIARIGTASPGIDLSSLRIDRRALESGLAAGTIDVAMDILLPVSDAVRRQQIEVDRLVVMARHDHPEVGDALDLATYLEQDHVMVTSRRRGPGIEDVELGRRGLKRRTRLRCQHYFAAGRVVAESDLILTMPERYARVLNRHFGNQILPLPLENQHMSLFLYWHETVDTDPANRWLRTQMLQALQS